MRQHLTRLWHRLEKAATVDTDSPEQRRRKVTLVVIAFLTALLGVLGGTTLQILGSPAIEFLPMYLFAAVVGGSLCLFLASKRLAVLLYPFLLMIFVVPIVIHCVSGGFRASEDVLLWAVLAPFGALMFQSVRRAVGWFVAYLVVVLVALPVDSYLLRFAEEQTHQDFIVGHSLFVIGFPVTIFVTMLYFVHAFQTEHARAESLVVDLRRSNAELESTLDELKRAEGELVQSEKMASLGQLTAGLAHEINNPVGAMTSASDVTSRCVGRLEEGLARKTEVQSLERPLGILKENIAIIQQAGTRVTELVSSLKTFVRLDEAEYQLADVREGLDSTLALLDHMLKGRITVKKEYQEIPDIACYPALLNQVFMSVLKNAVEAIEKTGTVCIVVAKSNDEIVIRLSDTGKGIPQEKLKHLFELSFSRDKSRVRMGSGLSIAHGIVQKHDGRLEVASEAGKGTTVSIFLPLGEHSFQQGGGA